MLGGMTTLYEETHEWKKIITKYRGNCINCDALIYEGETVWWMQNLGIKHLECPVSSEEPKDNSALVIIDEDDKKLLGIK